MRVFSVAVLALSVAVLIGCPKKLEGVPPQGGQKVTYRRVDDGKVGSQKTEQQKKKGEELQATSAARYVDAMRLALVKEEERKCKVDDDCALLTNHCCACENRGTLVGVARTAVPSVIQRRGWVCEDYSCPQAVSDDPSCNATRARCQAGRCVPDIPAAARPVQGVGVEKIPDDDAPKKQGTP